MQRYIPMHLEVSKLVLVFVGKPTMWELRPLIEHIQLHGILNPITVSAKNLVIDGKKRVLACRYLGIKGIPAVKTVEITDEELDSLIARLLIHSSFASINEKVKVYANNILGEDLCKLSTSELLKRWSNNHD